MTAGDVQFEAPTWSQIYALILKQAEKICSSGFNPDVIVGVSRGGWIPARILSDLLDNPNLANVKAECYAGIGEAKNAPELTQCLSTDVNGKSILVVDEIADTGRSLQLVTTHVMKRGAREVKTATLYYKPRGAFKPEFYEVETGCWVIFPWEINETVKSICETRKSDPARAKGELAKLSEAGVSERLINRFLKRHEAKTC